MINRWRPDDLARDISASSNADLASCLRMTRLAGAETDLALHGGGNASVKTTIATILGTSLPCLYVKGSGVDMGAASESDFAALDLEYLRRLRALRELSDAAMADEFSLHQLKPGDRRPSIEALMHAFLPPKFVLHTHPAALLALGNRSGGRETVEEALGASASVIPYANVGIDLALAVVSAFEQSPSSTSIVILQHGLVTWGDTARVAYDRTIAAVARAEEYLDRQRSGAAPSVASRIVDEASRRYQALAPVLRGALAPVTGDPDLPYGRIVLKRLGDAGTLGLLQSAGARDLLQTPPLTPDYLIRTRAESLWIDAPSLDNPDNFREQVSRAVTDFCAAYRRRLEAAGMAADAAIMPAVAMVPGLGVVCAGAGIDEASMVADITAQALRVKATIRETGGAYQGLSADHLLQMEFRDYQRAKMGFPCGSRLSGTIALVTGAAGAIGSGICDLLLREGCHVAAADLPGASLERLTSDLAGRYGNRVMPVAQDVTDQDSVAAGFNAVIEAWGGIDLVIPNAGIAHVCALAEMNLDDFRRIERVNVDGTLLIIREAARRFRQQNIGGDIVLVSTKNVFAPGAKFGAYSATKAAAHQIARIASLELAEIGVRVNMVAPDAVFSHGEKKSGLWATVGPDRMRARGLDEKGLEEYYRSRNLLKARVTSEHVARGVLYFATRQTPTTGATIPIDGGLPDSTPR